MTVTDEDRKAAWECFRDEAYYDMWCVRPVGSRTFGEGFHLVNGDEAQGLCELLNARQAAYAAGLERAAVIAEESYGGEMYAAGDWPTPEEIATAIRAEKDKTNGSL